MLCGCSLGRKTQRGTVAHEFLELEILVCPGWVLFAGTIEGDESGGSEYRAHSV